MVLTEEQLKEVLDIIEQYHNSYIYNNITTDLPDEVIKQLKDRGLIDPLAEQDEIMKRGYELSRFKGLTEDLPDFIQTYEQLKSHLATNPVPMTDFERSAIDHLTSTSKKYVEKHTEWLKTAFDEIVRNENMAMRHDIITGEIKTAIARGFRKREGINSIVSDIRDLSDDIYRDFHRIAQTELQNAINVGQVDNIVSRNKDKAADEIYVYKRPNPDACKYCNSAYLDSHGDPKIFKLSDLLANGTNYGKKARDWMPVHETMHPWCQCRLYQVQSGWGFKDGKLHFFGEDHDTGAHTRSADMTKSKCDCHDHDLKKAVGHKYIRREGTPGHYKYFYTSSFKNKISGKKKIIDKIKAAVKHHMFWHEKENIGHDEIYDIVGKLLEGEHFTSKTPIPVLVAQAKKEISGAEKRKRGRPKKDDVEEKPVDTSKIKDSPRADASKETKESLEDKEEYAFARESKITNKGEDLLGSARHKRNMWKNLEEAEKKGEAETLVTRDKLLKNEPVDFFKAVETNPLGAITAYYIMQRFIKAPDIKDIDDNETYYRFKQGSVVYINTISVVENRRDAEILKKMSGKEWKREIRQQYFDSYKRISGKLKETIEANKDISAIFSIIKSESMDIIRESRRSNRYSHIANQFVKFHNNALRTYGRSSTQTVKYSLQEFDLALDKKHRSDAVKETGEIDKPTVGKIAEYARQVLEGKKIEDIFNLDKKEKPKGFTAVEQYVDHAERKGPATHIKSSKRQENYIINKSKMRGLQWGNSVTDDERDHHMQYIADSFKDLTDILDLPDEMGSFNGKLGLAVGARGHGTALAHYEPWSKIINLTRKSGVGSLAHEWGHFFDNVIGNTVVKEEGLPVYSMARTAKEREKEKSGIMSYASVRLNGNMTYSKRNKEGGYDRAVASEESRKMGAAFENMRPLFNDFIDEMTKSADWKLLSEGKKAYWKSDVEVFARSFERYIQHKLHKNDRENTYLVGLSKKGHPFWPSNEMIKKMEPHFDELFKVFKETSYLSKALAVDKEEMKEIAPLMDKFFEAAKKSGYLEKAFNYFEDLEKGRKSMPVGTISGKYKKIAEGKWVPVGDSKGKADTKKDQQIKFTDELIGSQSGQKDLRLSAKTSSGKTMGKIDYTDYHGEISIKMIKVNDEFKGKGVAKDLVKKLVEQVPYENINWGMLTSDGAGLKQKLDKIFDYKPAKKRDPAELVKKFKGKILDEIVSGEESINLYVEFNSIKNAEKFTQWAKDIGSEHVNIQKLEKKDTAWVDVTELPLIEKEASAKKTVNSIKQPIDHSDNPTVLEYAVRYLFQGKSPKIAANKTKEKLSGKKNMFISGGVEEVAIDSGNLEKALWSKLVSQTIDSMSKIKEGKEHFALDGVSQKFGQKSSKFRSTLKNLVIKKLGKNPFTNDDNEKK